MKSWRISDTVGITSDPDNETLTFYAGPTAIQLNGLENKIAISGPIAEMHGGDKTEDGLLRTQASFTGLIPSTIYTPQPHFSMNLPIGSITGILHDMSKMMSLLG